MDLDDEELKATRMMNGADRKGRVNKMEQDINENIKILEESIIQRKYHLYKKDLKKCVSNLIKAYKELEEENKDLISDNLDYQRTLDIFDKRTYRKKYLEERRKEEPNLLYPDADEIYKRYYKLREENKEIEEKNKKNLIEIICYQEELENSIPVYLVEEKIEELNKEEQELQDSISNEEREEYSDANISYQLMDIEIKRSVLQKLLEKRK